MPWFRSAWPLILLSACGTPGGRDVPDEETCEEGAAPTVPRQVRLLTRAEYVASLRDLFDPAWAGGTCDDTGDCDVATASCEAGACVPDDCGTAAFVLPGYGAAGTVTVAGEFNGWSPTATPLVHLPEADLWYTKAALGAGTYAYKFVVDGSTWISDPTNAEGVDDGYGGWNSVLTLACTGEVDWDALYATLPVESRPAGYPFDNHVASGLASATHVERWLDAADLVVDTYVADPAAWAGCDVASSACVADVLARAGLRVLRRPLSETEAARYAALAAANPEGPEEGLRTALVALLNAPAFLYRMETGVPDGEAWTLTPWEVASALSYLLWGTTPDDTLLAAAASGALSTAEGRRAEAERLLDDPRAGPQVERFAAQWLGVEDLPQAARSATWYPDFDAELAAAMVAETTRFSREVVLAQGGTYEELLTAPYSWVDARVAALYGLPAPDGVARVDLPPERAGLLGQAAVLASHAHSDQTSPVRRGVFVRERLLCQALPAPPANAASVPEVDPDSTTRARYEQHTADPACASCHQWIDPVGFGLEHYDAIGAWRDLDNGQPVDATGDLPDAERLGAGTHAAFEDAPALGALLVSTEAAPTCFVKQVARFARGYVPEDEDCAVEDLSAAFRASGGDVRALLLDLVASPAFVERR